MVPGIKAKPVRLIDLLELLADTEVIVVTTERGRFTEMYSVKEVRETFKKQMNAEIIAMNTYGRMIRIYL